MAQLGLIHNAALATLHSMAGAGDDSVYRSQRGFGVDGTRARHSLAEDAVRDVDLSFIDDEGAGEFGPHFVGDTPTLRDFEGSSHRLLPGAVAHGGEDPLDLAAGTPARLPVRSLDSVRYTVMGTPMTSFAGSSMGPGPGDPRLMSHRRAWSVVGPKQKVCEGGGACRRCAVALEVLMCICRVPCAFLLPPPPMPCVTFL
jgi:hypothetical protein